MAYSSVTAGKASRKEKKLSEEALLSHLQRLEENSAQYVLGDVKEARYEAMREYFRRPYGNEEEGWSQAITSDVQDTIEWMLPFLLDMFLSSDDAVVFDPNRESDVAGAEQATDTCNYVFYKQNSGLMVLYTAFKDALQQKNCAVHWRCETRRVKEVIPVRGASEEVLSALLEDDDEIEGATSYEEQVNDERTGLGVLNADGTPMMQNLIDAKISRISERKTIKVEAFEPETLLIKRDWTSPLLQECPYVARIMPVTLSDLMQMGFDDVSAEDLRGSDMPQGGDADSRDRTGGADGTINSADELGNGEDDESTTEGYLRIEWVLVDFDGDGISERREVYRLEDKILSNEECSQVPIATGSPVLVQHRWLGMSLAEMVSDIQRERSDLMRALLNNAHQAANPRKTVRLDSTGAPLANIDDLLDYRPGGITQIKADGAIGIEALPFVGHQILPLFQHLDEQMERRTGVTKQRMGMDPNALRNDRTLGETQIVDNASQARLKLIGRLFAETLVKPVFQGILRLLTEGEMEPIAMRLRGEFVEYDPNEWRDSYDMTINVGTGTGDRDMQQMVLGSIQQDQMQMAPTPLGPMMVTPHQMHRVRAKRLELAGIKNIGDFYTDPGLQAKMPTPPPPQPPPQIAIKQMELQADAQKLGVQERAKREELLLKSQIEDRRAQSQDAVQRANDERDAQAKLLEAQYKAEIEQGKQRVEELQLMLDCYKVDEDNRTKIIVAQIAHPESELEMDADGNPQKVDKLAPLMESISAISAQASAPTVVIERDEMGRPSVVQKGGIHHAVIRDEAGRIAGTQPIQ